MSLKIIGKYTDATVTIDKIDNGTIDQIQQMCNHVVCTNPIAIMPDTHLGKGCVIGFTMEVNDKIIPNYVGVDVGCGMQSVKYDILATDFFKDDEDKGLFDRFVRKLVPMGFNIHSRISPALNGLDFYIKLNDNLRSFHTKYVERFGNEIAVPLKTIDTLKDFESYLGKFGNKTERILSSLGTLGGGNHFIECSEGLDGKFWVTVHTGSRNFGKQICDFHQNKAWDLVEQHRKDGKAEYIATFKAKVDLGDFNIQDIDSAIKGYDNLVGYDNITKQDAFLEGLDAYEYYYDMVVGQTYADWNRKAIHDEIATLIFAKPIEAVSSTHNYIDFNDFVIRKGAISSYKGSKMIIPFNSLDGILICEGKSNQDWNYSAPHGAGRIMSRTQAKNSITSDEAKAVMESVYASETPIDESPLCYKDPAMIENAIEPTATIVDRLKPVLNFKAK